MNWNQKRKRGPQNVNADHDGLSLRLYDRGEPHRHRRGVKIEENYLIPKITKSFFFFGGSVVMLCVHALAICMLTRQGSTDFDGR